VLNRPFRSALILVGLLSVVGSGLILLASRGSLPSPSVDAQDIPDPQQGAAPDEIRVSSRAYVAPSPYSIRVETRLVELNVAVHDWNGRPLHGLTRAEFRIYDEGKEREIATFSEATATAGAMTPPSESTPTSFEPAPPPTAMNPAAPPPLRFLALFVDDVNAKDYAAAGDLGRTQKAATKFVTEALVPGTLVGVFTVSGAVTQDFTSESAKLTETIARVKAHPRMSEIGLQYCPRVTPYRAYQIVQLHDRQLIRNIIAETGPAPKGYNCAASRDQVIAEAEETWRQIRQISIDTLSSIDRVVNYVGSKPGARVLVIASSGFFGQTLEQQEQAVIEHAIHSGVVINALDSKGLYSEAPPGCRPTDPDPMECMTGDRGFQYETMAVGDRLMLVNSAMADIAHGTGGEFFHNNNDLHAGLKQVGIPPEVTYRISFKPEGVVADGSYHKLKVKVTHPGNFDVVARPGYFAPVDKPSTADDPRSKLERAVAASDTVTDFPAGLAIQVAKPSASQRTLSVVVRIDISKLQFATQDGRKKQRIAFISALLDAQGKMVTAKEGWMDLALKPGTYDRLVKTGLNAKLTFQLDPGVYKLREVVEDAVDRHLSSSTNSIDVR
jgi:VWFA-related protein